VLLDAREIGEADIDELNIFVLDELEDFVRSLEHYAPYAYEITGWKAMWSSAIRRQKNTKFPRS
jgi:hypothetical protein